MQIKSREDIRETAQRDARLWEMLRNLDRAEERAERLAESEARARRERRERERRFERMRRGFELLRAAYANGEC